MERKLQIAFLIGRFLQLPFSSILFTMLPFTNVVLECVSSKAFSFIYLAPFEIVAGITCKNVFTSKLLLFKLLSAVFWIACVVIWINTWREVWCILSQLGILQFTLEEHDFSICPLSKQFQDNFSFSTNRFISNKGFDKICSQEPSLGLSEQNQYFIF